MRAEKRGYYWFTRQLTKLDGCSYQSPPPEKDRSDDLLHALRYERALAYGDLGQHKRARSEFERLYAEAPDYENVAARLKL